MNLVSPGMKGVYIRSGVYWDSLDRNSCVVHMQAEWESQCYAINKKIANTAFQAYLGVQSDRQYVFFLVRRWIYSHNLGIGLHGVCDCNAKEGEARRDSQQQHASRSSMAVWAQVLSSFILCLQLSNTCKNEGCYKSRHHKCANCKLALYCCKDCQVKDWSARHQRVCKCIANA